MAAVVNLYAVCCKDSQGNLRLVKFKANYLIYPDKSKAELVVQQLQQMVSNRLSYTVKEFIQN